MQEVAEIVFSIGKCSSRIEKERILADNRSNTTLLRVLRFIFDPYVRTGIGKTNLKRNVGEVQCGQKLDLLDVLMYFKRNNTGRTEDIRVAQAFIAQQETEEAKKLAEAIVTQDLRIGVTAATLNKIYGKNFIPIIGIMRGAHYKDVVGKVKGPYIVTEKLDGARRIIANIDGEILIYTRSGHRDEGLVEVEAEAKLLPKNYVYDAELLAVGEFPNALALRQATNSIANRKGIRQGVVANIFDMIPLDEFQAGVSRETALQRKVNLAAVFHDYQSLKILQAYVPIEPPIEKYPVRTFHALKPVPILGVAYDESDIMKFARPIWDAGFEGVMLNTFDGLYEVGETERRQLLKVKKVNEYVLKCIGVFPGEGRLEGTLGGIILSYKGHHVRCGTGFTDDQRDYYWNNREAIVGKLIEIESFGESRNQQGGLSLNVPVFKRIVGDE
mgnify:CR=1 FL=1